MKSVNLQLNLTIVVFIFFLGLRIDLAASNYRAPSSPMKHVSSSTSHLSSKSNFPKLSSLNVNTTISTASTSSSISYHKPHFPSTGRFSTEMVTKCVFKVLLFFFMNQVYSFAFYIIIIIDFINHTSTIANVYSMHKFHSSGNWRSFFNRHLWRHG